MCPGTDYEATDRSLGPPTRADRHVARACRLYGEFFHYLTGDERSPLTPSLRKLKLKDDRWRYILATPFLQTHEKLEEYAAEAAK